MIFPFSTVISPLNCRLEIASTIIPMYFFMRVYFTTTMDKFFQKTSIRNLEKKNKKGRYRLIGRLSSSNAKNYRNI
jgi:hypothetical protein